MAVINLKLFDEGIDISTDDDYVIIQAHIWEEGAGSFELAEIRISHSLAKRIGIIAKTQENTNNE